MKSNKLALIIPTVVVTALLSTFFSFILFQKYFVPNYQAIVAAEVEAVSQKARPMMVDHRFRTLSGDGPEDFVNVSGEVTEAVVNIRAMGSGYRLSGGSGVILSSDGYIVTNYHVIEGASRIEVTLNNKREMSAKIIGVDPTTDLALLKVRSSGLKAISFGDSDGVKVGQWVLAIGNPFNLASTVTAGIVSAKARNINILGGGYAIESFIQTDAAVNPGNSGGALVNEEGELVGINTAIMTEDGSFEGYSFAVPANLVFKVVNDLKEFGKVKRALLGVNILDVDDDRARNLGLPEVAGVYIERVNPHSGAADAGLQSGDVIMKVNGVETTTVPQLQEQVARFRPGDKIAIEFFREGKVYKQNGVELKGIEEMERYQQAGQ